MAKRVTLEDIKNFNELYYSLKTYAAVARETGFSASTVSKYVDKNYIPDSKRNIKKFDIDKLPDFKPELFLEIEDFGTLCELSDKENEQIKDLWEELSL